MAIYRVDKRVAACMVEAIKGALVHLSELKIHAAERGTSNPKGLLATYGQVRRLRYYVEGTANSYQNPVALDLGDEGADLLCSCMLLEIGRIESQPEISADAQEKNWIEEKVRTLEQWIGNIATKPIEELPRRAGGLTPRVRNVLASVRKKFLPASGTSPTPQPGVHGASSRGLTLEEDSPVGSPSTQKMPSPQGMTACGFQTPDGASSKRSRAVRPAGFQERPRPFDAERLLEKRLLDPDRIRDPRLRTMMSLDLSALLRTVAAEDYRLAAVHLASVFEAAIIDQALPRSSELGLAGNPDVWRLPTLVVKLIGDIVDEDRSTLARLAIAPSIVRPGKQLREPLAVTPEVYAQMRGFVQRILVDLGLAASAESAEPSS